MSPRWHLGNDVVDTLHRGSFGKAGDERFLARVCSAFEQDRVRSSPDPDVALWVHWAGKEAIYKSASKALGAPPTFHHSSFHVVFPERGLRDLLASPAPDPSPLLLGEGAYQDLSFRISVERIGSSVHAVSWLDRAKGETPGFNSICLESRGETRGPVEGFEDRFSPGEWGCITHRASALTRLEARRAISATLGVPEEGLEIRCGPGMPGRRIPSVWLGGEEIPLDLSLSHHGRFLAWAFLRGLETEDRAGRPV